MKRETECIRCETKCPKTWDTVPGYPRQEEILLDIACSLRFLLLMQAQKEEE